MYMYYELYMSNKIADEVKGYIIRFTDSDFTSPFIQLIILPDQNSLITISIIIKFTEILSSH